MFNAMYLVGQLQLLALQDQELTKHFIITVKFQ